MKFKLIFYCLSAVLLTACGTGKQEPADSDSTETQTEEKVSTLDTTGLYKYHGGSWYEKNKNHAYFKSEKVDAMVMKNKLYVPEETDEIPMDYDVDYLEKNDLESLTTRELIYYCLAYKNSFSQICAGDDFMDDGKTPKIPGMLPFDYSGLLMSNTQRKALESRKDSVVKVLSDYILANDDKISTDYLQILEDLHAVNAIPALISTASEKNLHNYTVLLSLMYTMKYQPLLDSPFYEDLYGNEAYTHGNRIEATPENRKAIVEMARAFYKGGKES
ncbi:MAG TPA: hypothetical protein VK177_21285 [Flavobacteriales bacterium]|nr:hypothetical protein [Flavobacteriales bacterium]